MHNALYSKEMRNLLSFLLSTFYTFGFYRVVIVPLKINKIKSVHLTPGSSERVCVPFNYTFSHMIMIMEIITIL